MPICVPAVLTRHRLSHPVIYPSAPRPGVERLLRQRVMRRPQQAVRRNASSHKPPPPLFSTRLEHPNSGMQNVLLWHVVLRACCSHTSPPQRPTAPPQRSSPWGREASASARHAATHHADGRQTQGFLTHTSITPLPYHPRASQLWHAKCSAIACRFACLLCSHVTAAKTHRSTSTLLTLGREPSASARHAATHHADGRQTQGFLTHTSITPLPYQPRPSRVWHAKCSAMACPFVCLRFTRHRLSDPLLRPGVERLLRPRVMRRPIMQQARPSDTSKASSHKPPSPLFPTMLQHPESGIQNVVLWHDVLRACFSRTSPYCVHRGVYPLYVVIGTFEIKRVYPPCVATRDFLKTL